MTLTCAQAKAHIGKLLARRGDGLVQITQTLRGRSLHAAVTDGTDMLGRMSDIKDDVPGDHSDSALSQRRYILQELVQSLS